MSFQLYVRSHSYHVVSRACLSRSVGRMKTSLQEYESTSLRSITCSKTSISSQVPCHLHLLTPHARRPHPS